MKPILGMKDGKVTANEKQRTSHKALSRLKELAFEQCPKGDSSYITVSHCGGQQRAKQFASDFEQALNVQSIPVYEVPPAIVVHGRPGLI